MDEASSGSRREHALWYSPRVRAAWRAPQTVSAGVPSSTKSDDLPIPKRVRVWFELIRTLAAISQVTINTLVALKVFGKI